MRNENSCPEVVRLLASSKYKVEIIDDCHFNGIIHILLKFLSLLGKLPHFLFILYLALSCQHGLPFCPACEHLAPSLLCEGFAALLVICEASLVVEDKSGDLLVENIFAGAG
jgi:hypothetical protein